MKLQVTVSDRLLEVAQSAVADGSTLSELCREALVLYLIAKGYDVTPEDARLERGTRGSIQRRTPAEQKRFKEQLRARMARAREALAVKRAAEAEAKAEKEKAEKSAIEKKALLMKRQAKIIKNALKKLPQS